MPTLASSQDFRDAKTKLATKPLSVETYADRADTICVTSRDTSWRLVHDDSRVVTLFESGGYTRSKFEVEVFAAEKEALDRIKALGLKYTPEKEAVGQGYGKQ